MYNYDRREAARLVPPEVAEVAARVTTILAPLKKLASVGVSVRKSSSQVFYINLSSGPQHYFRFALDYSLAMGKLITDTHGFMGVPLASGSPEQLAASIVEWVGQNEGRILLPQIATLVKSVVKEFAIENIDPKWPHIDNNEITIEYKGERPDSIGISVDLDDDEHYEREREIEMEMREAIEDMEGEVKGAVTKSLHDYSKYLTRIFVRHLDNGWMTIQVLVK